MQNIQNLKNEFHILKPVLALEIGEAEAILLERVLVYTRGKAHVVKGEEGKWIYNSLKSWRENHFPHWSMYKLRKTIKSLEEQNLIQTIKANSRKWNQTKWYQVNEEKYSQIMGESLIGENDKKSTNRVVGNQQMIKVTESYYTNKSSYKEEKRYAGGKLINKESKEEREGKQRKREIEELLEEIIEERVNERVEERLRDILHGIEERSENKMIIQKGFNFKEKELSKRLDCDNIDARDMDVISKDDNCQLTIQTMIELWNKVFEHSVSAIKAYSNKKNQQTLLNIYQTIFNSDLNNWREYALKVNSSQFLMGEKKTKNNFKAVFGWLIKPETIEKILSGEYGVGDRELDINNQSKNAEIKKEQKVTELESRVARNLKENLNEFQEYEEFTNYIQEEKYEQDNDKYKLGMVLRYIPKRNFLNSDDYKIMRDRLFESYLIKKHTDQSRSEIRQKLRAVVDNPSDKARFNITKEISNQADCLMENTKNQKLHTNKLNDDYKIS